VSSSSRVAIAVLVIVAVGGAFIWWRRHPVMRRPAPPVTRPVAPAAPPTRPAPAKPAIVHPLEPSTAPSRGALPALDDSDPYLKNALGDLLGRKSVMSFLIVDSFARRFVATVNNLATDDTSAGMWPVHPTVGHLDTEPRPGGGSVIGTRNADRYATFVRFVEGVDTQRAVALYVRLYPLLQRAYEDLGFPGMYFNDRVVEVIDHLLATPEPAEPIKVKLVEVNGLVRPPGRGGLYLFEDPALEASSSGQKILLRIGRESSRKLKAKLSEIRQLITKGSGARLPGNR
jgi:hypothetical protein